MTDKCMIDLEHDIEILRQKEKDTEESLKKFNKSLDDIENWMLMLDMI